MAGSSTSADQHSGSATSPTTSPGVCWRPAASGRDYTLDWDEPVKLPIFKAFSRVKTFKMFNHRVDVRDRIFIQALRVLFPGVIVAALRSEVVNNVAKDTNNRLDAVVDEYESTVGAAQLVLNFQVFSDMVDTQREILKQRIAGCVVRSSVEGANVL